MLALGLSFTSFSQVVSVTTPTGGFEIDGNLVANSPTNGAGDWVQGGAGSGGFFYLIVMDLLLTSSEQ